MKNLFKCLLYAGLIISLESCTGNDDPGLAMADAKAAQDSYRQAWLTGDSSQIMKYLSDSIILFPPGKNANRVQGKEAVSLFWFSTTGDTTYPIKVYEISGQEVFGKDEYVFFTGKSYLEFETLVRDSVMRRDTSRSEFFSVYKKENGDWKIFRQMWSVK